MNFSKAQVLKDWQTSHERHSREALTERELVQIRSLLLMLHEKSRQAGQVSVAPPKAELVLILGATRGFRFRSSKWPLDLKKFLVATRALAWLEDSGLRQFYYEDESRALFSGKAAYQLSDLLVYLDALLQQIDRYQTAH